MCSRFSKWQPCAGLPVHTHPSSAPFRRQHSSVHWIAVSSSCVPGWDTSVNQAKPSCHRAHVQVGVPDDLHTQGRAETVASGVTSARKKEQEEGLKGPSSPRKTAHGGQLRGCSQPPVMAARALSESVGLRCSQRGERTWRSTLYHCPRTRLLRLSP